jgi:hypothetical protein
MRRLDADFWRELRANDCALPSGHTLAELSDALLELLGSPDPELRDTVAYETLATWMSRGLYAPDVLRAIGRALLPRLSAGVETPGTAAVFERAFAMLVLAELVHTDNKAPFLGGVELRVWLAAGLDAFARERDLRGYVPEQGWAHATAHAADLCAVAARNSQVGRGELQQILDAIAAKLRAPTTHVFVHLEDERLAAAVVAVLRRELLDVTDIDAWLTQLTHNTFDFATSWFTDAAATNAVHNTRAMLRSLYFQLNWGADAPNQAGDMARLVELALRRLDGGFYTESPATT